ncbi:hypothetical protein [Azohydromonas caseinilytica]|uniref:Uncharacterized protein n=1 Tax=Azohydromonas caseinilytica TaxID=2728836 RepID=A0A848FEU1_9BURK|nr:hypothetical protein [Azohydromonas caseinilytica]NML17596.1 hypothetical protein [Azohydromonas caseinilytica]
MARARFWFIPSFVMAILALSWTPAAQAGPTGAHEDGPQVRIVHCSDVTCDTVVGLAPGQPMIRLAAHYPEQAGRRVRVVVVSERDKHTSLIDVNSHVQPNGRFGVSLPVHLLPQGVYDIGVMGASRFLAEGQIRIKRAATPRASRGTEAAPARPARRGVLMVRGHQRKAPVAVVLAPRGGQEPVYTASTGTRTGRRG